MSLSYSRSSKLTMLTLILHIFISYPRNFGLRSIDGLLAVFDDMKVFLVQKTNIEYLLSTTFSGLGNLLDILKNS